jgi:hypothetical protein
MLNISKLHFSASTIRAELTGCRRCSALGLSVNSYAPVCALARRLIAAGHDPNCILEVYRESTLCFATTLGTAAGLMVEDGSDGVPRFRKYRPPSVAVGPPVAPTAATLPEAPEDEINAARESESETATPPWRLCND